MTTVQPDPDPKPGDARRAATAAGIGNFMEWFDFALYGFFAATIGDLFFPSGNSTTSLLAALAVFGVAFFFRPLGGIVIGALADRTGRRAALSISVLMMGGSTLLIAVLPTHASVGVLAPILLVILRGAQGFSAGAEYTGAAAFIGEYAPRAKRGLFSSVISGTAALGSLAGALIALGLEAALTDAQIASWGWRVPFLLAAPIALVGLYLRLRLEDTPVYRELQEADGVSAAPMTSVGRRDGRAVAIAFACTSIVGLGFYYLAAYAITFLTKTVDIARADALVVVAIVLLGYIAMCPFAGVLSDRHGRRPIMLLGIAGLVIVAIPAFAMVATGNLLLAVVGLLLFAWFEAMINVTLGVLLVELFPAATRVSSSALGFNAAQALVGGPGPLVAAALASGVALSFAPALYVVLVGVFAGVVLVRFLPETRGVDLDDGAVDFEVRRPAVRPVAGP